MNVLVVGGNRFVGRFLAWRLLAGGHRVTLFNRGTLADPFGDAVERLAGDRTGDDFARLLRGRAFDAVVDFAAYTGADGRAAVEVLSGRTQHYVMISTGQVYLVREGCPSRPAVPIAEEFYDGAVIPRPDDPADVWDWEYGIGKRDCEDALAAASARGFPATRVRIPMVNGPGDYLRRMEGYLWRLVDDGPVILPDGGTHRVRHVDGREVARFVHEILGRAETFGRAFNLAQEETPTLAELVERIAARAGSAARIVAVPTERLADAGLRPVEVSPFSGRWMSFLDPRRARDELGFRHAPLDETIATVVAAFQAYTPRDRPDGYARGRAIEREIAD